MATLEKEFESLIGALALILVLLLLAFLGVAFWKGKESGSFPSGSDIGVVLGPLLKGLNQIAKEDSQDPTSPGQMGAQAANWLVNSSDSPISPDIDMWNNFAPEEMQYDGPQLPDIPVDQAISDLNQQYPGIVDEDTQGFQNFSQQVQNTATQLQTNPGSALQSWGLF